MDTDKIVDAVQSTAEALGKFAELAGKVGAFVSKVVGKPAEQIGGILDDQIRLYRYKNLCRIADKVEAIHRKRRIEGMTLEIPPRLAIPMLEAAALEDDETLQDVWARLIANSTNPAFKQQLHPGFIEVVKQLSPDEAVILNSFLRLKTYPLIASGKRTKDINEMLHEILATYGKEQQATESFNDIYEAFQKHCNPLMLKTISNLRVYIDNLVRLRIVELGYIFSTTDDRLEVKTEYHSDIKSGGYVDIDKSRQEEFLKVTQFGQSFIAACIVDTD